LTAVGAERGQRLSPRVRGATGLALVLVLGTLCRASASDPLSRLLACRDISDATARLTCFDRETAALAAASPAPPLALPAAAVHVPSSSPAATAPRPPLDAQQQFGLPERTVARKEVAAGQRSTDAAKIQAHIAGVSTQPDGRTVFRLDNDQTWRQLLAEGDLLSRVGDVVTISRGALGSYWLQVATGRGCKVTRVR